MVPEMFGGWPLALGDCDNGGMYKASMLLLFNPWRKVNELKNGHNSFSKAFAEFEGLMSVKVRERIDHIQSYYKCDCGSPDTGGNSLYDKL
jgi:hypothetical protein